MEDLCACNLQVWKGGSEHDLLGLRLLATEETGRQETQGEKEK